MGGQDTFPLSRRQMDMRIPTVLGGAAAREMLPTTGELTQNWHKPWFLLNRRARQVGLILALIAALSPRGR